MIVVKIKGGLGNQMFEYAMARKLSLDLGIDQIALDITRVNQDDLREFGLDQFSLIKNVQVMSDGTVSGIARLQENIARRLIAYFAAGRSPKVAEMRERKLEKVFGLLGIVQRDYHDKTVSRFGLRLHKNIYMNGWFQEAGEINEIRSILLNDFKQIHKPNAEILRMESDIRETESVCMHIRRGDYVNHPQFGICTEEYFYHAMEEMTKRVRNPIFYIFSDSLSEVKKMDFPYPVFFDDERHTNVESLYLMSKCKHFIISNSTYSWWAQFLSENNDKTVIAPNQWCRDGSGRELYMDEWVLLDV